MRSVFCEKQDWICRQIFHREHMFSHSNPEYNRAADARSLYMQLKNKARPAAENFIREMGL